MSSAVATPVANGADRRKSGRAVHAPPVFSQEEHYGSIIDSAKRKRPSEQLNGHDEVEDDDQPESETDEEDEDGDTNMLTPPRALVRG